MEVNKNNVSLPVLVMRGMVLLPNTEVKLEVGRDFSKNAINMAEKFNSNHIFVTSQIDPLVEDIQEEDINEYGVVAIIKMKMKLPNGNYKVILKGIRRGFIDEYTDMSDIIEANILDNSSYSDFTTDNQEVALTRKLIASVNDLVNSNAFTKGDALSQITTRTDLPSLTDILVSFMPMMQIRKQMYIEEPSVSKRVMMLLQDIKDEQEISTLESRIDGELRHKMDKAQKEYYLREKLRVIKEELGDVSSKENETDEIREKIESLEMPKQVKEKALAELKRFESMSPASQEGGIIRNYLDWIITIPWSEKTTDNSNLNLALASLDGTHHGLKKVKDRIIEYLAVKEMTNSLKSPILCLVGPPGTGKTSLAKSIAEAIDRKFVKVSLGGVRDEAEIRGHRRTYLGAMPGRIIQGMKKVKVTNPVFLLDELDKMTSDFKGDPASALLEVLDPEQNAHFSDHYLEEEYDLSDVMFIATANYLNQIPAALRDRLEIIQLSGYTEIEKLNIAKVHLIERSITEHGLKKSHLKISDSAYYKIIRNYTREAGVRQLGRHISTIARKTVTKILKDDIKKVSVTNKNVGEFLGKELYSYGNKEGKDQIGVATGLAYTQFGGDILPIEVTFYPGKGRVVLTGKLGDVMKESAQIALSYIKSNHKKFGVDLKLIQENDIHVHVPEGAVPKDGPSAGITLATAMISALTNKPVRKDVGMTGEITLRGLVLPIGGLKEKSLSAHRSGLTTIIIPRENEKDIEDIPQEVRDMIEFVPVKNYSEVLKVALR